MQIKLIFLLLLITVSCVSDNENKDEKNGDKSELQREKTIDYFTIDSPYNSDTITLNSLIDFKIALINTSHKIDSVRVYMNGRLIHTDLNHEFSIVLAPEKLGNNTLSIKCFLENGLTQQKSIKLFLLSDVEPRKIKYRLVNTYPHSTENFTEGLVYKNGLLYESTGNWGKSAIFVSNPETGELIQSSYLPSDRFGEGIAILNNQITQLTYKSMEGYVYQQNSLNRIKTFKYPFYTEGWGLTTGEKDFIMSNGSEKIYVLDSAYYSLIREITVCDNKEPLDSLNELEYVNGLIYSNIWMNNKIAEIDYKSGKVLGYLDLTSLIPPRYRNHHSDVLNGIAYNRENASFLITGKHWDKIYEIKLED